MIKKGKEQIRIMKGTLISLSVSLGLCFAGIAVLSHMITNQSIGESGTSIYVSLMLLLSTLFGGQALWKSEGIPPVFSLLNALIMTAIVFVGSLLIDGNYQNVLFNIGGMTLGGVISFAICLKIKGKGRGAKRRYR